MSNLQIFTMFVLTNALAQKTGETVIPLNCSIDSLDYYCDQLLNLGFNTEQIDDFASFMRSNSTC